MKSLLLILFITTPIASLCQLLPEVEVYRGNIDKVVQKKYAKVSSVIINPNGSQTTIGGSLKYTGLKTTMNFDSNTNLIRKELKWRKLLAGIEYYERDTIGNKAYLRTSYDKKGSIKNPEKKNIKEYTLNEFKQPYKYKNYFITSIEDSNQIITIDYEGVYKNGNLISFKHVELNFKLDTLFKSTAQINYNDSGQVTEIIERSNGTYSYYKKNISPGENKIKTIQTKEPRVLRKYSYTYDTKGNLAENKIEMFAVYTDDEENINTTYTYEYDKFNNWTVRYKQKENQPKLLDAKQKIKYRK